MAAMLTLAAATLLVGVQAGSQLSADIKHREAVLVQTWNKALDGTDSKAGVHASPVARVVSLLKEMQQTLQKEMAEDEALYKKLACWCSTNQNEKSQVIADAQAKIKELTSTIDGLGAKTAELKLEIEQSEADVASGKEALATATALREKENKAFHSGELESVQNIENLKAAILVLERHSGAALPQLSLISVHGRSRKGRDGPWSSDHESEDSKSLDQFLDQDDITADADASAASSPKQKFLQEAGSASSEWSTADTAIVKKALKTASVFMQQHSGEELSYAPNTGEIIGMLKQLKDEMQAGLTAAQKAEAASAADYAELRKSKLTEIDSAAKTAEKKEDQLARAAMDLSEAKEDLHHTEATLTEDQKFMLNLQEQCANGDKNFDDRKTARLSEIKAVSDTIGILTADEARDTMSRTFSFLQISWKSDAQRHQSVQRWRASRLLRSAAKRSDIPELAILATRVELDSFTRVKKAIDDMVAMLKQEEADEVKKNDWCKSELHENDMDTRKTEDRKADLTAKVDDLSSSISGFADEISAAKHQIGTLHLELQRASENRQKENLDFQQTIADQRATQHVLKVALERLAKYYDEQDLLQTKHLAGKKQTPPVAQAEYKPHAGANSVMSLIEKLVLEAIELEKEAQKSEAAAQTQYESMVNDTNASVAALQKEIVDKVETTAAAKKEKLMTEGDLADTVTELENLGKYNSELHGECNYLLDNFDIRQEKRGQEIEALQQAKRILSGASLN